MDRTASLASMCTYKECSATITDHNVNGDARTVDEHLSWEPEGGVPNSTRQCCLCLTVVCQSRGERHAEA